MTKKQFTLKYFLHRYFIKAMGSMAQGLFASLLIGTIFTALGMIPKLEVLKNVGGFAQAMAGPAMAVAIAWSLEAHPLVIFSAAAVGNAAYVLGDAGGPLAVFFIAIISVEIGMLVSKKTKVDIIVTPFITVLVGGLLSIFAAPKIGVAVGYISKFIGWASIQTPLVMGILVSVVIGICLTLPVSSAAICKVLILTGNVAAGGSEGLAIAGAAAVAGCCAQMVGFAVISFRENGWGGLLSQGIGTSMLQMPNIIRHPQIWIAPTLASAITGPLAVCVFGLKMYGDAINSGMGTCGFLGPVGMLLGWISPDSGFTGKIETLQIAGLVLICFVLPAVLSLMINEVLRKIGLVKDGYMKLED
ncbi:MAG: PTS sugar transporter subunit IIC [Clostridia bacterium]|nr:PTS sugar transporter subunit IIC [Clostridia bacterium]